MASKRSKKKKQAKLENNLEKQNENLVNKDAEEASPEINAEDDASDNLITAQEQREKEEFSDMMQGFRSAVEQVNQKDPDEETLIRLFGESDSDSLKEKVIEHPFEIGEKQEKRASLLVLKLLYAASATLFAGILVVFGVISVFDKDKTVSEAENRVLAQRPEFSLASLFAGEYTVNFENYYSDNFPARDYFIQVNGKIKKLLTGFSAGDSADVIVTVDKSDDDFAGEGIDLGNSTTQKADENTAAVTPDNEATVKNSIIISHDRAMEIYTYSEDNANKYAALINKTAKAMPQGVKFYSLLAPTSVEFYGTKTYREGRHSQLDAIDKIYSKLDKNIVTVDAYTPLMNNADEYIFFRTDHHWTARGAYYAYSAFCNASGNTAPLLDSFATHNIDNFVGSLYRTSQAQALKNNPDYVECFQLQVDASHTVYTTPEMTDGVSTYIVAKKVNSDNKYLAFVSGDQPLGVIETGVTNGKKILVIKESFGNAFIPFLCNNYEEIYIVDPRRIDMYLPDFVEEHGIQEVMAINYCFGISNSTYTTELDKLTQKTDKAG